MRVLPLGVVLLFAPLALGMDAGSLALLVLGESVDASVVAGAIADRDPLVRATAARLASVRQIDSVIPKLREALAAEANADAAREQIRALIMLGSDQDVALAGNAARRFPSAIDDAVVDAIGRIGGSRGLDLYLDHAPSLRKPSAPMKLMFWGRSDAVTEAAARLLSAGDPEGWKALLTTGAASLIPNDVIAEGLRSSVQEIRVAALSEIVRRHTLVRSSLSSEVVEALEAIDVASIGTEEAFGRELLRRLQGQSPIERAEWTVLLRKASVRNRWLDADTSLSLLTPAERAIVKEELPPRFASGGGPKNRPQFRVQNRLPRGLDDAIAGAGGCREAWYGEVTAAASPQGTIADVAADDVDTTPGCRRVIEAILRLSLVEPDSILSGNVEDRILVARAAREPLCFDEKPVTEKATGNDEVVPPKVVRRVDPASRRKVAHGMIVIDSVVTTDGCVLPLRLVERAAVEELNKEAAMALSRWRFKAGQLNGQPVDTSFALTINFLPGR